MRYTMTSIAALAAFGLGACTQTSLLDPSPVEEPESMAAADDQAGGAAPVADEVIEGLKAAGEHHLWLEEVEGDKALEWVRAQNDRSLADLKADPRYEILHARALEIVNSDDRIPYGRVRNGEVYNFWQDETNVRGLWRKTSLESYATDNPVWETILDFDKLAADEDKNWVYKGGGCYAAPDTPDKIRCLLTLSDGGKDAAVRREFDLASKSFVEGGFVMPEAKAGTAWVDYDTVLVGTDWGGDGSTLTESGYPSVVKRWTRGTAMEDAVEIFRGDKTDVGVWPFTIELEDKTRLQMVAESDTFFTSTYWWFPDGETEPVKLPIPPKATPEGIYKGQFLFTLEQDWQPEGQPSFSSGDLLAFSIDDFMSTRALPPTNIVFRPTGKQAVNGVAFAKGAALLSINDNVRGRILRLEPTERGWSTSPLPLPANGQSGIAFADQDEDVVFLNYEGFLTPDSLYKYEPATGSLDTLKSLPEKFDAEGLVVQQFEATSRDGTQIPYFVVHREDIPMDGSTPTLQYGYGGFQISMLPRYSAFSGSMWLEKGGAYILANIRGGGEFGPEWHQAGLKTKRQVIYDDFQAVAEDAIAKGITSPEKLGIMGGSNGGLLMGVSMTQRPDLWNAVVVQVPLLDMLRYHKLLAGASWVDEYGSPDDPEERAWLEQMSPYHNFDPDADYPTPFFVTSTKDDRVHPGHARKMAKRFEEAGKPFLYYENIDGGHSAAANLQETAKRSALEYTYLHRRLFGDPEE